MGQPARFSIALQPLKIGANVRCVLVAEITILLQSFENDVFKFSRQIAVETNGRRRNRIEDALEDDTGTLAVKGHDACRHFV